MTRILVVEDEQSFRDALSYMLRREGFEVDLADADRGVYESLALRVARHPSESEEYLLTRILASLRSYLMEPQPAA